MRLIAFTAPAGGVGCTTVAAHAALILQALGHDCLAVELQGRNQIGAHLGLPQPPQQGWAQRAAQGLWWGDAALSTQTGLRLLPFGPCAPAEQSALARYTLDEPGWLRRQLQELQLPPDSLVLLDVGPPTTALAWQALELADAVVCCTTPALDSVQALPALLDALRPLAREHAWLSLLACRMDGRRPSHNRGWSLLHAQWPRLILEEVVHEDEAVPQSWAQGCTVQLHAPHSLASHDLQGVSHRLHRWLTSASAPQP